MPRVYDDIVIHYLPMYFGDSIRLKLSRYDLISDMKNSTTSLAPMSMVGYDDLLHGGFKPNQYSSKWESFFF